MNNEIYYFMLLYHIILLVQHYSTAFYIYVSTKSLAIGDLPRPQTVFAVINSTSYLVPHQNILCAIIYFYIV